MREEQGQPGLWHRRSFVLFWTARTISAAGSAVTVVILPIVIYRTTGSATSTALLTMCQVGPYIVFGLFAGAMADRYSRRFLLVATETANALVLASVPIAAAAHALSLVQIYVVAVVSATLFVWYDTAATGGLKALVGRDMLLSANSAIWAANTVVGVIAPPVGVFLASIVDPPLVLWVDAISYALAVPVLLFLPRQDVSRRALHGAVADARPDDAGPPEASPGDAPKPGAGVRQGLRYLWQHPVIRAMTALNLGAGLSGGAVYGLIVVFWAKGLGRSPTDPHLGVLLAVAAAGAFTASLLMRRLRRIGPLRLLKLGFAADPLFMIAYALAPGWRTAVIIVGLWNFFHTGVMIVGISLRQELTPDPLQSRVNATGRIIAFGSVPVGAALGGVLVEAVGARPATLFAAIPVALSGLCAPFILRASELAAARAAILAAEKPPCPGVPGRPPRTATSQP